MSKTAKITLLIVGGIVLTLAVIGLIIGLIFNMVSKQLDKYGLDQKVQTYLEALEEADSDKLHRVSYDRELELSELLDNLAKHEIVLEGEITVKRSLQFNINVNNSGVTINAVYRAAAGAQRYTVTVRYRKDAGGEGIDSFFLKPT